MAADAQQYLIAQLVFYPFMLFNVIAAPLMYCIMLKDSRYWTGLSILVSSRRLSNINWNDLQGIEALKNPVTNAVALEMRNQHENIAEHIHWTTIHLEKKIGSGATGSVWKAEVQEEARAVKQMQCDVLDETRTEGPDWEEGTCGACSTSH